MVAISLYRGNLHRVPDVPRRWLMPNPKISLKEFKSLLARRSRALSRLRETTSTITTSSNPNPNPSFHSNGQNEALAVNAPSLGIQLEPVKVTDNGDGPSRKDEDHDKLELVGCSMKKPVDGSDAYVDSKIDVLEKASEPVDGGATSMEKQTERIFLSGKEERKREVEDKLQVLNAKKHNLVLVMKQILNAEEELKRRNSMQGIAMGSSGPLQTDGTTDTGSITRHLAPRMGSDANLAVDVEGGEADYLSGHNIHSRHMLGTSSLSPSSESPLRRTPSVQQNMVSHPSRASLGAAGSPSRFALSGHQGNPMNLPSVSVSGTSYIASSPSPAASGGTSVFRDARQRSPGN